MDRLSINLADYGTQARGAQYGSSSQEEVAMLNKALEATDITGRQTTNLTDASGAPLKVESLERTLKHLTFRESDIVLWKNLPKRPPTTPLRSTTSWHRMVLTAAASPTRANSPTRRTRSTSVGLSW